MEIPTGNFNIRIPVKVPYSVLNEFAKKKLIGERIHTEVNGQSTSYAEILDIDLARSLEENFELAVDVKLKTLTTLFSGKEASVLVDASFDFNTKAQKIAVKDYRLQVNSDNWLMSKSLQGIANTLFHDRIRQKMRFDFRPLIQEQLRNINIKMEESIETAKGIYFSGFLKEFEIKDIIQGEKVLLAVVEIQGKVLVDVKEIDV